MAASKFLSNAAIQFKLGRAPPSESLTDSNSVAQAFGHQPSKPDFLAVHEKNNISKELLKIKEKKKLVLAKKKQLVNEKNQIVAKEKQIVAKKNQILSKKKQIVEEERQQSETQMNDMKILGQNKNLADPEAHWVILLIKEQIKNKWLACAYLNAATYP
ncbi:hypothetical protein PCASD_08233 [Puccinia coronata f. sp. avenae]|uniref:No apical meristem-associated C-terminal domain-containing protein n=1 Tax=Puccinia coronata f. sp. avenae TaxID=200324 RepID=A0A2N5ULU5_9BASI|nr:hypothetical protein PCASD_08233 [Puccinia coronata f. sp. avenae]